MHDNETENGGGEPVARADQAAPQPATQEGADAGNGGNAQGGGQNQGGAQRNNRHRDRRGVSA